MCVNGTAAPGGVLLDGYGNLHPFGGFTINTSGNPYWNGWDIARSLALEPLSPSQGGWELDGWGGIHAFGNAPNINTPAYWSGWDIARALVVLSDNQSGYLLDGYGGVHQFGPNAPVLSGYPYWGWDIARGLEIHLNVYGIPDGGWTLDGWGNMHNFGAAPATANLPYYPNYDQWQRIHKTVDGAGNYSFYAIGRWGVIQPIGSPAGVSLSGIPDWGSWDIVRDIVPVNASNALAFDTSREFVCPNYNGYATWCGWDQYASPPMRGRTNVLFTCGSSGATPGVQLCAHGCTVRQNNYDYCY
jgi:hypothetical protein